MRLLALATVTADGRPLVGPVDGVFYRGRFYFGSSPDSVRFRHLARRADVSATHLPGEELAVTVHGRAVPIDVAAAGQAGFRQALLDIYVPRYGPQWETVPRVRVRLRTDRPLQDVHLPHGSGADPWVSGPPGHGLAGRGDGTTGGARVAKETPGRPWPVRH